MTETIRSRLMKLNRLNVDQYKNYSSNLNETFMDMWVTYPISHMFNMHST